MNHSLFHLQAVLAEHDASSSNDSNQEDDEDGAGGCDENSVEASEHQSEECSESSKAAASEHASLGIDDATWQSLYAHQQEGLRWLWKIQLEGKGGILADDMG